MKVCSIDDCHNKAISRTWCNKHYRRWYEHGDPNHITIARSPQERLTRYVRQDGDCISWVGGDNGKGYCVMTGSGLEQFGGRRTEYVHRAAWMLAHGPIAPGYDIDHKCHNRRCVNVDHLQAVTRKGNLENTKNLRSDNTSGYRNVVWSKQCGKWIVLVGHNGKTFYGGLYTNITDANNAAIALRLKHYTNNMVDRGTNK